MLRGYYYIIHCRIDLSDPTRLPSFSSSSSNQQPTIESNRINNTTSPINQNDFLSPSARPDSQSSSQRLLQHRRHRSRLPSLRVKTAQQPLSACRTSRRDLRPSTIASAFKTRLGLWLPPAQELLSTHLLVDLACDFNKVLRPESTFISIACISVWSFLVF